MSAESPAGHGLAVSGLPADSTEQEVHTVFQTYGEVSGIELAPPDPGTGAIGAKVVYMRRESAETAKAVLHGRYKMRHNAPDFVSVHWMNPQAVAAHQQDAGHRLLVEKLPVDCLESHVQAVFVHYGEILCVNMLASESRPDYRSALVAYASENSAHDAIKVLDNQYRIRADSQEPITVRWAEQGPSPGSPAADSIGQQSTVAPVSVNGHLASPTSQDFVCSAAPEVQPESQDFVCSAAAPESFARSSAAVPAVAAEQARAAPPNILTTSGAIGDEGAPRAAQRPLSPNSRPNGFLLQEHTSSVKVMRIGRQEEVQTEVEEVVIVPVLQQVERVVEREKEVLVEEPRYVFDSSRAVHRIEQIEEVEGPVVYVDRIIEVPVDTDVEEPVVQEVEKVVPRTFEVVHHIPRFVSVPQVVERIVQRPVEQTVEKVVQVEKIVPVEVIEWEDVELIKEVPKIVEEIVKVPLRVQKPRVVTREVPVQVPQIVHEEQTVEQDIALKEQVIEERTLLEASSQVHVIQEQDWQVAVCVPKPKYVEVPQVQYVDRIVEKPVTRKVLVDVRNPEPLYEVHKTRVEIPRIEYRDKEVQVPRVRKVEKTVEVEKEVKTHESHHIIGKMSEQAMIKYMERFVDVPKVRKEHIDIAVNAVVMQEKVEDVPLITEVIRYEEKIVEMPVVLKRQRAVVKEVERIFTVPKYVFEEAEEAVDLVEEHISVVPLEERRTVQRVKQRSHFEEEVKEVLVGKKAGRNPQCLNCLKSLQNMPGDSSSTFLCAACGRARSGSSRWQCASCNLAVCTNCEE